MKKLLTLILIAFVAVSANAQLISGRTLVKLPTERKDFMFVEPSIGIGTAEETLGFMANLNLGWRHKFTANHSWDILKLGVYGGGNFYCGTFSVKTGYRFDGPKSPNGKRNAYFTIGVGLAVPFCDYVGFAHDIGFGFKINKYMSIGLIAENALLVDGCEYYQYSIGLQCGFEF